MFIGILFIVVGIVNGSQKCQEQQIIYKYIPRTFKEEQESPVYVSDIFKTMFSQSDTWVTTINETDQTKKEKINDYFISKM
jgi:hypothetical protein